MLDSLRVLAAWFPLMGVVACGSDQTSAVATTQPSAPSVVDPACTTQGIEHDTTPSGSCLTGAECVLSTPAGLDACERLHIPRASASPDEWKCTCADGMWSCEVTGGGLGLIDCPDAGGTDASR